MADPVPPTPEPRRVAGGFTVREYEHRVWDMSRHLLHPAFLYVLAVVAGGTRLLQHPLTDETATSAALHAALFTGAFLGAWACFYSTLLRDAGLPSLTVTILVPAAALAAILVWAAFPAPPEMARATLWLAAACLVAPAPPAFVVTLVHWRRLRREHAHLLPEGDR